MLTFETKVWENDWEFILKNNYLDKMIANCNLDFDQKTIIINNVKNRAIVEKHCEIKVKEGIIDASVVARAAQAKRAKLAKWSNIKEMV